MTGIPGSARPIMIIALGVLILGAAVVWPHGLEVQVLRTEIDQLERAAAASVTQAARLEKLANRLDAAQYRRAGRHIPAAPHVDIVLAVMAGAVEGEEEIYGPTMEIGLPKDAVAGSPLSEQVLPVRVDLNASFPSVLAMIRAVERMPEVVRVSSVRIESDRLDGASGPSTVTASLVLEVVYDPL